MDTSQEILEKFVLRARRIEAHSLVSSQKLWRYLHPRITVKRSSSGTCNADFAFPDEEKFESLVARMRPLLVESESIYFSKVIKAFEELVASNAETGQSPVMKDFREQFKKLSSDSGEEGDLFFSVDGEWLPASLLALSWLYGDLVHVDARGKKSRGKKLPYEYRLFAGLSYFAKTVSLALAILGELRKMRDSGQIRLSESVWAEPVALDEVKGIVSADDQNHRMVPAIVRIRDAKNDTISAFSGLCYSGNDKFELSVEGCLSISVSNSASKSGGVAVSVGRLCEGDDQAREILRQMQRADSILVEYVRLRQVVELPFRLSEPDEL